MLTHSLTPTQKVTQPRQRRLEGSLTPPPRQPLLLHLCGIRQSTLDHSLNHSIIQSSERAIKAARQTVSQLSAAADRYYDGYGSPSPHPPPPPLLRYYYATTTA
eukprot:GHVU01225098.1.p2 GENE.GHVU01225098.1~~GHVU01225098.1.p2  ORF type:complete len:104 (-),score=13.55 GHVU01225098.1:52-363(-)